MLEKSQATNPQQGIITLLMDRHVEALRNLETPQIAMEYATISSLISFRYGNYTELWASRAEEVLKTKLNCTP